AAAEKLLLNTLKDAEAEVRLQAARGLLLGAAEGPPTAEKVRRIVHVLGGSDIDDRIEAAQHLGQVGVDQEIIRQTIAVLEGERRSRCPECAETLTARIRASHLKGLHGYLDVFGALLPRPAALVRLWERVFREGDVPAHERLCEELLAGGQKESAYAAALEGE